MNIQTTHLKDSRHVHAENFIEIERYKNLEISAENREKTDLNEIFSMYITGINLQNMSME